MFFDIHTHTIWPSEPDVKYIFNQYKQFYKIENVSKCSLGIHPWYINKSTLNEQIQLINNQLINKRIIAIGETGLDKVCNTDWQLQIESFQEHIRLSNESRKPLVIHCVKAFSETNVYLREANQPIIIHGVNNKLNTVKSFIDNGYFLSFGAHLLNASHSLKETFMKTPIQQMVFETDDNPVSIKKIYKAAADLLKMDLEELKSQIQNNIESIFQ